MSIKVQLPPIHNEDIFEDFICDLYNYNEKDKAQTFQRFGKKGNKQKGIDVISIPLGIAIQCKKKEIKRHSLVEELKIDFESDIKKVLSLKAKVNQLIFASTYDDNVELSEYLQELKIKYNLSFNVIYIGWQSLSTSIQEHPILLKKYFPQYFESTKIFLTPVPFFDKCLLLGRDDLLGKIQDYVNNYSLFTVQGIGGVGKTATLATYINQNYAEFDNIIWIEVQGDNLLNNLNSQLSLAFKINQSPGDSNLKWKQLIYKLNEVSGKNLIVIDGLDLVDDSTYNLIDDICSANWKTIISSRLNIADYPTIEVYGLSASAAVLLFKRFYNFENIDELIIEKIAKQLDYHPLTLELIAKAANSNTYLTLANLYKLLKDNAFDDPALNKLIHVGKHAKKVTTSRQQEIYKYLLLCFNINALTKAEDSQLLYFSVLPQSAPISLDFFLEITGQEKRDINSITKALAGLDEKGWISRRGVEYYIHPILQIVVREKLKITGKKIEKIIFKCTEELYQLLEVDAWKKEKYIHTARNILNTIRLSIETLYLSQFYALAMVRIGDYERAIKYYEICLHFLKDNGVDDPDLISSFYNNLGNAYTYAGRYNEAIACLVRAIDFKDGIHENGAISLGRSLDNFASVLDKIGRHKEALVLTKNAIQIFKQWNAKKDLALAYTNFADTLCQLQKYKKALFFWEKGARLLKKYYESDNLHFADSYNTIGNIYLRTNKAKLARASFEKSLLLYEKDNNPDILALGYSNLGLAFLNTDQFEEAKKSFDLALSLQELLSERNIHHYGMINLNIADYYIAIGEKQKALESLRKVLKIYNSVLPAEHPDIKRVQLLVKTLKSSSGNSYLVQDSLRRSMNALSECISFQISLYKKIIKKYGEAKVIKYDSDKLEDTIHDYLLFCFTKSCKDFIAIEYLIKKELAEAAQALLYSVYRTYLTVVFIINNPEQIKSLISIQILASKRELERPKKKSGAIDELKIIASKTGKELNLYLPNATLLDYNNYEEDLLVHKYYSIHLSDHAYSNFMTSGNYRNKEEAQYTCKDQGLILQPMIFTSYLQLLIFDKIVSVLNLEEAKDMLRNTVKEDINVLRVAINKMEFDNIEIKNAMLGRLNKIQIE